MVLSLREESRLLRQAHQRAQKTERLTSEERDSMYTKRRGIDEITGTFVKRIDANIHHIQPVAAGGQKRLSNLMLLDADTHEKLHEVADEQRRKEDRKGKLRHDERWGEITQDVGNTARELTRMSRILDGESPKDVYPDEYRHDRLTRERIDRLEDYINENMEG